MLSLMHISKQGLTTSGLVYISIQAYALPGAPGEGALFRRSHGTVWSAPWIVADILMQKSSIICRNKACTGSDSLCGCLQAEELAKLLRKYDLCSHVNLIPW